MSAVQIRPFRRSDRDQVAWLVNMHAAAVVPAVSASVNAVLGQFEREPDEFIVDPWVAERAALVAEVGGSVAAAALVVRYRDDEDVSPGYRGAADIRWLLFRPHTPPGNPYWPSADAAAEDLMTACLARCARWGGTRVLADGALPVPGVYGVPAQWPHIEALYRRSGFAAPDDAVEIVHLLDVNRGAGRRPAGAGLTLERSVGTNGTRFSAVHGGEAIGYLEVEVLDGAERHPRGSGLADVGNLHVRPDRRRQGVATLLLGEAVHWLRLGRVDRLLHYARSDETALLAFVERAGFEELTRTRRGWERSP